MGYDYGRDAEGAGKGHDDEVEGLWPLRRSCPVALVVNVLGGDPTERPELKGKFRV